MQGFSAVRPRTCPQRVPKSIAAFAVAAVLVGVFTATAGASEPPRLGKREALREITTRFDLAHSTAAVELLHRFDARPAVQAVVLPGPWSACARLGRRALLVPATVFVDDGARPWKDNAVTVLLLVRERRSAAAAW